MSIAKILVAVRNDFDASLFKVIIAAAGAYLALAVTLIFKLMDHPYTDLLTILVGGFVIAVIAVIHWVAWSSVIVYATKSAVVSFLLSCTAFLA